MLQNGQERDLLGCVHHLAQDGVENIQVRTQVHSVRTYDGIDEKKRAQKQITTLSN
jgi:hypothetical protein